MTIDRESPFRPTDQDYGRQEHLKKGITVVITDFSKVLLFFKDPSYTDGLNAKHRELSSSIPEYNILDHFRINQQLLDYYASLKARGITVIIYTSETIQDDPNLLPLLRAIFEENEIISALKENLDKKSTDGYRALLAKLNREASEVVFVDDTLANIEASSEAGIKTVHFQNTEQAISELEALLS